MHTIGLYAEKWRGGAFYQAVRGRVKACGDRVQLVAPASNQSLRAQLR